MPPAAVFVRPNEVLLSTLLHSLSIAAYFARISGGRLTAIRQPRAPETQRLLNFSRLSFSSDEVSRSMISQAHRIPINRRATLDLASLSTMNNVNERGAGLVEVAALAGINPATLLAVRKSGTGGDDSGLQREIEERIMEEDLTYLEAKVERQTKGEPAVE